MHIKLSTEKSTIFVYWTVSFIVLQNIIIVFPTCRYYRRLPTHGPPMLGVWRKILEFKKQPLRT